MLAEIILLRLDLAIRLVDEASHVPAPRFVPIARGMQRNFKTRLAAVYATTAVWSCPATGGRPRSRGTRVPDPAPRPGSPPIRDITTLFRTAAR
jgi:hypothetical protein